MEPLVSEEKAINLSSPDAPLKLYQKLIDNALLGKDMNVGGFLEDLDGLILTGEIDEVSTLRDQILDIGQDPLILRGAFKALAESVNTGNLQQIQNNLRRTPYLGMDQPSDDPTNQAIADQINQWGGQYEEVSGARAQEETVPETEERLAGAQLIAAEIERLMSQHNISEDEAYERLRTGQTTKKQKEAEVKDPGRRAFLKRAAVLTGAALVGGGIGRLTTPYQQTPEQTENTEQSTILDEFLKPMIEEIQRRRAERARIDPEYYHRVDRELNDSRINMLLFVSGAFLRHGHEPTTNRANQIISYNTKTKKVDLISITGDVRGPKAEQYAVRKGQPPKLAGINDTFDMGKKLGGSEAEGLKLLGETFEEATGLSIDFQGIGTSGVVKDFVDQVFGGLEVNVPYDFNTFKVDIDGVEYPDYLFKEGRQKMDGVRVVQYIAADDYERLWTRMKDKLHHNRKHIIIGTLRKELKRNLEGRVNQAVFGTKFLAFLKQQLDRNRLKLDFDLSKVFNFGVFADPSSLNKPLGFDGIKEGQSVLIVDPVYGGEGVKMVKADAQYNPKSRKDLEDGKYPDLWWLQIPPNSNPDAKDLVKDYWGVKGGPREIIKRQLLS